MFLIILIPLFLTTCITPLDVEPSEFDEILVVQGFINNDFGPHKIRISRVAQFSGTSLGGNIQRINGATVNIVDQAGIVTPLQRFSLERKEFLIPDPPYASIPCTVFLSFANITTDYLTPETFRGEVGNTYTLEITTQEGKRYRSKPQTMLPTPEIDSLVLAFKEVPGLDPIVPDSGVEVFSSWKDPSEEENFYFWRLNGIYKIFTPDRSTAQFCCPYDPRDGGEDICWIIEENIEGNSLAFSDQRVNGQNITQLAGFIKDNGLRFADRSLSPDKQYYVELEQYSIPEEAFEFNERLGVLADLNGEIFDPPPTSIRGNVFNTNDPEELVIGYFGAFAVQKKNTFIKRDLLEFIQLNPRPCGDCRLRSGSQLEIPQPYRE